MSDFRLALPLGVDISNLGTGSATAAATHVGCFTLCVLFKTLVCVCVCGGGGGGGEFNTQSLYKIRLEPDRASLQNKPNFE